MPDWAWDFARTIIGAGFGTAAMTAVISLWKDKGQRQREASFLAMRLAVTLERFASACSDLISANASAYQGPNDAKPHIVARLPELADYPADGDGWKALDSNLAAACLNFRNQIDESQSGIRVVMENAPEILERVVRGDATDRGLDAWNLACRLRSAVKLKQPTLAFDYPACLMKARRQNEGEEKARLLASSRQRRA